MSNHRNRIQLYPRIAVTVGALLMLASPGRSQVLPPDSVIAGKSMSEWAVLKSQWIMTIPAATNPLLDTTGEFAYLGDQGPVFFLDGTFGGPTVTRDVTIRDDQYIHIGLLSTIAADFESDEELLEFVISDVDTIDNLFLEIDGAPPAGVDLYDHRQRTPDVYELDMPEGAIFDFPPGTFRAFTDGYAVMLEPLSRGDHTLFFGGGISIVADEPLSSVFYNVHVVPEPSGASLWTFVPLLFGIAMRGIRRRAKSAV